MLRRFLLQIELDDLATDLGIPATTLARVEAGDERPGPAVLARIASYLGAGVAWFFHDFAERTSVSSATPEGRTETATEQSGVGETMLELLDQFMQVTDAADREAILDFTRARVSKQSN